MKNTITAVAVILISAIIMLIPELIHSGFQFAAVDWQCVVVDSLIVDVSVYFAFLYAGKNNNKDNK